MEVLSDGCEVATFLGVGSDVGVGAPEANVSSNASCNAASVSAAGSGSLLSAVDDFEVCEPVGASTAFWFTTRPGSGGTIPGEVPVTPEVPSFCAGIGLVGS